MENKGTVAAAAAAEEACGEEGTVHRLHDVQHFLLFGSNLRRTVSAGGEEQGGCSEKRTQRQRC